MSGRLVPKVVRMRLSAQQTEPGRVVQPHHQVGSLKAQPQGSGVVAVDDPGGPVHGFGEALLEIVPGGFLPARSPEQVVGVHHRQLQELPQPPGQGGLPGPAAAYHADAHYKLVWLIR